MRYRIEKREDGLEVEVGSVGPNRDRVLAVFQACQEGRCRCPIRDAGTIDSLEVRADDDTIRLRLRGKPGGTLDPDQVQGCLEMAKRSLPADD